MSSYNKFVDGVLAVADSIKDSKQSNQQYYFKDLLTELKLSHKDISERECKDLSKSKTKQLISKIIEKNISPLYNLLKEMIELLYLKQSPMLKIVYQFIPIMLRLYIEIKEIKNPGLEKVITAIQTNELISYTRFVKEKQEVQNNPFVRDLYQIHFNAKLVNEIEAIEAAESHLDKHLEREDNDLTRIDHKTTKILLWYVIYKSINCLDRDVVRQYLNTIFMYCGGQMKDFQNVNSFYMLQKKNMFNPFRYSISEQEIEWMLLTLYELSIQARNDRLELLAVINMIYKKTANQSMFKYSQIAQSIIHILEDEYQEIFS